MATRTVTLPSGRKARSKSQRRYVLFVENDALDSVTVVKRSDSIDTIRRAFSDRGHRTGARRHVVDTATGEFLLSEAAR